MGRAQEDEGRADSLIHTEPVCLESPPALPFWAWRLCPHPQSSEFHVVPRRLLMTLSVVLLMYRGVKKQNYSITFAAKIK